MFEIKKGFYVSTLHEHIKKHKKDIASDVSMLKNVKKYTTNEIIVDTSNILQKRLLGNYTLSEKYTLLFYKISYLYYLKDFFPFNYNTIDVILKEYDFLIEL